METTAPCGIEYLQYEAERNERTGEQLSPPASDPERHRALAVLDDAARTRFSPRCAVLPHPLPLFAFASAVVVLVHDDHCCTLQRTLFLFVELITNHGSPCNSAVVALILLLLLRFLRYFFARVAGPGDFFSFFSHVSFAGRKAKMRIGCLAVTTVRLSVSQTLVLPDPRSGIRCHEISRSYGPGSSAKFRNAGLIGHFRLRYIGEQWRRAGMNLSDRNYTPKNVVVTRILAENLAREGVSLFSSSTHRRGGGRMR